MRPGVIAYLVNTVLLYILAIFNSPSHASPWIVDRAAGMQMHQRGSRTPIMLVTAANPVDEFGLPLLELFETELRCTCQIPDSGLGHPVH